LKRLWCTRSTHKLSLKGEQERAAKAHQRKKNKGWETKICEERGPKSIHLNERKTPKPIQPGKGEKKPPRGGGTKYSLEGRFGGGVR